MYGFLDKSILDKTKEKLIFYDYRMKGDELFLHINSLAFYLVQIGIKAGQSVGICLPNVPHAIISFYATNKIGAIANVIHPRISSKALSKILDDTDTKIIFMLDKFIPDYKEILERDDIMVISCSASDYLTGLKKVVYTSSLKIEDYDNIIAYKETLTKIGDITRKVCPFDDAVYLHSGGTTSEPKVVRLSSYAFNKLVCNVINRTTLNHDYEDTHSMLMVLPIFHGFGLGICVHLALSTFRLIMMPKFNAKNAIRLIKKHKINYLAGIPVMFEKMLAEKGFDNGYLSSLLLIFCGSDRLNPNTKEAFDSILKKNNSSAEILEGYGLSEVASVATVNVIGQTKIGTQGRPIDEVHIKITDEHGAECRVGEDGEVLMQSQSMMNGYLNYDGNLSDYIFIDNAGKEWLKTGDIGCVDADGYFIFKGRKKRIIKIAGESIFPSEIESLVCSMKEIENACVVRSYKGDKPHTILIIKMNKGYKYSILIKERIRNRISEEFIHYAVPREIIVVDNLHITNFGKVDYRKYELENL